MAVRHGYGKIAGTDALVFAYDTGDTRNSYKGEPTTNNINGGANVADCISGPLNYGAQGGVVVTATLEYYSEKRPHIFRIKSTNDTGYNMINQQSSILNQSGTTYTYSYDFKQLRGSTLQDSSCTVYGNGYKSPDSSGYSSNVSVINTPLEDGWTRRAITYTATYTGYNYYRFNLWTGGARADGAGDFEFLFDNFQIESNSHATPFTNNTRSATEGLLDLTGNSTPDISNMSFNSNAELVFDGTDDGINVGNISALSLSDGTGTVEAIVKLPRSWTAGSQYPNLISKGATAGWDTDGWALFGFRDWGGPKSWGFGMRNGATNRVTSRNNCPADVYLHIVATIDGSTIKLYENGSLYTTNTQTINPAANNTNVYIGRDASSERFPGEIPIAKIYNRALTASEIQSNFLNYRKRFSDLANYYDNSTDGGRWIRFWWYTGVGWPGHEPEALGHPFGTFDSSSHYGFQRLPEGLNKDDVELLAKDGSGNIYKWDFANGSETAQRVWDSMTQGTQGTWANRGAWNPTVIAGSFFNTDQDTWQYRVSEGVASFLLDDDTCDCKSTLNAGHAMCGGSSWNQTYAQPDGAYLRYGVDTLNDGGCLGPTPERSLELFYRLK